MANGACEIKQRGDTNFLGLTMTEKGETTNIEASTGSSAA